jgi:hypothetical protein
MVKKLAYLLAVLAILRYAEHKVTTEIQSIQGNKVALATMLIKGPRWIEVTERPSKQRGTM